MGEVSITATANECVVKQEEGFPVVAVLGDASGCGEEGNISATIDIGSDGFLNAKTALAQDGAGSCRISTFEGEEIYSQFSSWCGSGASGFDLGDYQGTLTNQRGVLVSNVIKQLPSGFESDIFDGFSVGISKNIIPSTICGSLSLDLPIDIRFPCAFVKPVDINISWNNLLTNSSDSKTITLQDEMSTTTTIPFDIPNLGLTGSRDMLDVEVSSNFEIDGSSMQFTDRLTGNFDVPELSLSGIDVPREVCVGSGFPIQVFINNLSQCLAKARVVIENLSTGETTTIAEKRVDSGQRVTFTSEQQLTEDVFNLSSIDYEIRAQRETQDGFEDFSTRNVSLDLLKPSADIVG